MYYLFVLFGSLQFAHERWLRPIIATHNTLVHAKSIRETYIFRERERRRGGGRGEERGRVCENDTTVNSSYDIPPEKDETEINWLSFSFPWEKTSKAIESMLRGICDSPRVDKRLTLGKLRDSDRFPPARERNDSFCVYVFTHSSI